MRRLITLLLACYVLLIVYVSAARSLALPQPPFTTLLITLTGFTFSLLHASQRHGGRQALLLLALTFAVSLAFESIGVATGKVYGPYHYTDKLGVKFLGLVPLLIAVAWFMMMYPSLVIAGRILSARWQGGLRLFGVAALGAVIMTAWDLPMDPAMVAGGNWVWGVNGAYFGVPLQNYCGWWLTTFVTFVLFLGFSRQNFRPSSFDRLAVISYAATGLSSIIFDFQIGLHGPALVGIFAMLPWVIVGWINTGR